jgi:plastocyanin
MGKGLIIGIIIVAIVVILILVFSFGNFETQEETSGEDDFNDEIDTDGGEVVVVENDEDHTHEVGEDEEHPHIISVEMSSSGFSPSSLTINSGDTVTFLAVDDSDRWPATDIHPSHKLYPGSDIQKCFSGEDMADIFDSCGIISEGDGYSFTFNEIGIWSYHDHKAPSKKGTIVVE